MNIYFLALLLPLAFLSGCGGGGEGGDDDGNSSSRDKTVLTTPSAGRILAAQCAQCHGTDGISVSGIESLAGESGEIRSEMLGMKSSNRNRIMHLQAKGYSRDEIIIIAKFFNDLYRGSGGSGGGDDEGGGDNDNDGGNDDDGRNNNDNNHDSDDD